MLCACSGQLIRAGAEHFFNVEALWFVVGLLARQTQHQSSYEACVLAHLVVGYGCAVEVVQQLWAGEVGVGVATDDEVDVAGL